MGEEELLTVAIRELLIWEIWDLGELQRSGGGGWVDGRWLEQLVDGGEQGAGVPAGAVDEG